MGLQLLKDNPITTAISVISTIAVIIGTFLSIDSRYAHAEDLSKFKAEQQEVIQQNRTDLRQTSQIIRRQYLEDKVFDIELITNDKRTQIDQARLTKYKRDLDIIDREITKTQ